MSEITTAGAAGVTVREATFALLRSFGMTSIFGNPGSTELLLFRDMPPDFRYVLGLQESVVLAMADGYAQATHRAAAVSLHSAGGVGHAMGSLVTAFKNRTPLVILSGQQARSLLPGEPYLLNDQAAELPRPYVKWSREPARAEDVPAAIARAYYLAMAAPTGPTLVSVPTDDWDRPAGLIEPRTVSTTLCADPELLSRIGQALAQARSPAFIAGSAVDREGAFGDVVALAEAHQARVWAPPMSHRCGFPETHPLFAGFLPAAREDIVTLLAGHDVILSLGAPVFTYHVPGAGPYLPPDAELFQLTDDPGTAAWTPLGTAVLTSIRPAVRALLGHRPTAARPAPPPREAAPGVSAGETITVAYLMATLADVRPRSSVIVEEAPTSRPVMCDYLPNERPESFYTCASGAIGHGLPAAVGQALARPGERVIAVLGDGSAMYSIQALWSAAELNLPLTVIIVNNHGYATVDRFAERYGMSKPPGTVLNGIDFTLLARAQGCAAARAERPDQLAALLSRALSHPAPFLVEVPVTG